MSVDEAGNVSIARLKGRRRSGVSLHIGFDKARARMWLEEKGRGHIIEFEVAESFLDKLRRTAVPEHGVVHDMTRPWRVDVDFPDQYAIPPSMFDELEKAIVPGSGRVRTAEDLC